MTELYGQDVGTTLYQVKAVKREPMVRFAGWYSVMAADDGLGCWDHPRLQRRFIHSIARELDHEVWAHVSLSRWDKRMPTWEQVRDIWRLLYPDTTGIVVIPPEDKHVNLAEVAHVWGCLTATPLPDFTRGGRTI